MALISMDAVVADVAASLRARLIAAGPLLPALVACNGVPWVLASLGLDEAEPPPEAVNRPVPPRIARFYWRRMRAYIAWSGYVANQPQTPETAEAIKLMITLVAAGGLIASALVMHFYRLDAPTHARLVQEIAARKSAEQSV
jgi:hypothetical protein